jgi:hypothetical protein
MIFLPVVKMCICVSLHKTSYDYDCSTFRYAQLNARMKILLHASMLSFDHFKIYDWRIIAALQRFKNLILVVRFFCE